MTNQPDNDAPADLFEEARSEMEEAFRLDDGDLLPAIEAILMVTAEPVSTSALSLATGMKPDQVEEALRSLQRDYDGEDSGRQRGFELRFLDDGWRIFSRSKWAPWVGSFVAGAETAQLTQAALETLAIVAYRQPVTRGQIARVRGVNVDGVLRTLLARDLVEEVGTTATGAHLFGTTTHFLERMGLSDVSELVPLAPFMPGPESVHDIDTETEA
ncbi:SMC-Scp complex subunit ScpB [Actinomycetaceae bacterium MB13-C1-2]|nr:SMC-Scp complex subunit ScpB [Actinomycetaceae bacterium MB13-C1-2]